tara:strand:+ start:561 stop:1010 length:450 start_codon:yes stop_codon:yes gene_type:complete
MKIIQKLGLLTLVIVLSTACTSLNHSMKEANTRVELRKNDFTLSDQVTGEATETTVFGFDFERLFNSKSGSISNPSAAINASSIPVIGAVLESKAEAYALYELMKANPGYDVVFYPQFETKVIKPVIGFGLLTTITTVKVKARLGKLNK